jgi:multidrug resistance protein, MATE family
VVLSVSRICLSELLSEEVLHRSVRVGNELGAGNPRSAAFSAWMVTALSAFVSAIAGLVTFLLRDKLSYIFTTGEVVSRAVADLCPLLVGTILLCGIQPVLSGKVSASLLHRDP